MPRVRAGGDRGRQLHRAVRRLRRGATPFVLRPERAARARRRVLLRALRRRARARREPRAARPALPFAGGSFGRNPRPGSNKTGTTFPPDACFFFPRATNARRHLNVSRTNPPPPPESFVAFTAASYASSVKMSTLPSMLCIGLLLTLVQRRTS